MRDASPTGAAAAPAEPGGRPPAGEKSPEAADRPTTGGSRSRRLLIPLLLALVVLAPLAYLWQNSRVPRTYSAADMGYPDYGGGAELGLQQHRAGQPHDHSAPGTRQVSVRDLVVSPAARADVRVHLVARQETVSIGGRTTAGYTLNGRTPGPTITTVQGQLVEVSLTNASVPAGVSLHWHGVDVPNAMDGVAGVTQDAVPVGGTFVYRFVATRAGTFWYHSHQLSDPQVAGGLFGPLVVRPPVATAEAATAGRDVLAVAHTYTGTRTLNGRPGEQRVPAEPGQRVRVRVVNTDNGPVDVWSDAPYRVVAVDGSDLRGPTLVRGRSVVVTSGCRVDVEVTAPAAGTTTRVQVATGTAVVVGPVGASSAPAPAPEEKLDLLSYGAPGPVGFDVSHPDRSFDYVIGRQAGFVRGRPGLWWSVNGHLYPHVPMFMVREGDVVVMHIRNQSGTVHPMHLHGHHMVVLSRNGVARTGSPWWVDSLNVLDGESYDVAFRADNPGIWMDHCHNLQHAAAGMVAHLMYEGVDTPYRIGGSQDNRPE